MGIGIALAGGGIRGIAHAGVLKALEDNRVKVEAIAGTSAGSIVATLYAMGYKPYYIYVLFKKYAQEIINIGNAPIINGIGSLVKRKKLGISGLNDGTLMEKMFNELALRKGVRVIGDIKRMPLVISTVDIAEAKEYILTNYAQRDNYCDNYITEIGIGKAVRASSSFPAFFCPCEYKNHIFMDGGVLDNTPVLPLKQVYNKKVIAINFEADPVEIDSDVMDITMKTLDIMGNKIIEDDVEKSDFILTIPTDDEIGFLDSNQIEKCYKCGYKTAMEKMDEIHKILSE